jgi:hypothetical protein
MTEPGLAAPAAPPPATGPRAQRPAIRWMQRLAEETSTAPGSTVRATDTATATAGDTMDPMTDTQSDDAAVGLAGDAVSPDDAATGPACDTASTGNGRGPDESEDDVAAPLGVGVLFVLGLLWLAAVMWSVQASIVGNSADPGVVISSAALALPGVVAAALLAGAASALAATSRFARPASSIVRTVLRRLLVGAIAGAGVGVVAAGVILFAFGANAAIAIIAATVGVSAILGSAAATLPAVPLGAGIAATLSVFISGVLLNLFQSPLKSLLGAGGTVASQTDAADRFLLAGALVSGLVAGVVAYLYLRRRETGRRWPWYLLAGATPGLASLVGELLTQVGGASLFGVVGGFSEADTMVMNYLGGARVVSGLAVTFAGGIAAMILVGRTMRRPEEPVDDELADDERAGDKRADNALAYDKPAADPR